MEVSEAASTSSNSTLFSRLSPLFYPLTAVYRRFDDWRDGLGLPSPGSMDAYAREIRNTLATDHCFDGARVDVTKSMSLNPLFQLQHSLSLGGMQMTQMGPQQNPGNYRFTPTYVSENMMMQGAIEGDGTLQGVMSLGWTPKNTSKVAVQLGTGAMAPSRISVEQEHLGKDYTLNLKLINPSPVAQTGFFHLTYLQAISQKFTIGAELIHQRPAPGMEDSGTGFLFRYASSPVSPTWYTTLGLKSSGFLDASYYHRLSQNVELATELNLSVDPRPRNREAMARVGARYEFRASQVRIMADSAGKISSVYEQKIGPTLGFSVSGEVDQHKHTSKFGIGMMLESSLFTEEEMQAKAMAMQVNP